jgi:hypothetical protein
MRRVDGRIRWILGVVVVAAAVQSHGVEPVDSRIESVGMFKNGLSLVRRSVQVPGAGVYQLSRLPEPVHGTWWVESDAEVHTRVTRAEVEVPLEKSGQIDFLRDLAGSEVTVFFADGSIPPATGRVVRSDESDAAEWDRQYETTARNPWSWSGSRAGAGAPAELGFLVLQSTAGTSYIERSRIAYIQEKASRTSVTRKASAEYDRIVEWIIPDTRRPDGRPIEEHQRNDDPERYDDSAWDVVRFRNPFDFPMTTGPAMVVDGDRFNGQRMSYWANPGEQTVLHITKSLSLRTRHVEVEEPGERETVDIGGRTFRRIRVKGEVVANNHRAEAIDLVVRRRFSGELVEAGGPRRTVFWKTVFTPLTNAMS